ncbi:putative aminopeptidase FrvX [Parabacteroides sp. PF5-5]|uniref:hypothetical protein n=1 Tax=unclassified Parabacteroides TaxID=2649774 RepID=UPI00247360F1|nr:MULTISPECIES: hypothetical protein [unclassified Parabacteroides]MDH6305895.1 putative aminopeptidase FrvX [Parabacteroides sp. PH5-39]MDH6317292.1 putative aminopeptidase FrvX [Parabacteroides sp. PF5-13]MDH6320500.1 putative aminopeptidase FrvX [Parabacteroides sp. PH5-13]MDH6324338.1 putative aminopeptidase FrvX [Parabacteroides sp. PH5-8]MDH6328534.1 putative aminopeptidase FrvX [Parabacteroides sp. PH5-41]
MTLFNEETDSYLDAIIETPTPSGFEKKGQEIFASYAMKYVDSITTDTLGNIIALKKSCSGNGLKLMISAHMDEVGFMVKYIDNMGMVYIVPIGGVNLSLLPGLQLILHHNKEKYVAVVGRKPIHLLNENEKKCIETDSIWLDLGFASKEDALKSISIGDIMTYSSSLNHVFDNKFITHSADNKIGGLILLEIMKNVNSSPYDIYFVSTVQEEIGLRGVTVVASQIEPDIALVIDATHATDYPLSTPSKHGDISLGKGPTLCISPDIDKLILEKLCTIANLNGISYQMEGHPNGTTTEARVLQIVKNGIRTALISYPVRYMHSPIEMFSIEDVKQVIKLSIEFCSSDNDI